MKIPRLPSASVAPAHDDGSDSLLQRMFREFTSDPGWLTSTTPAPFLGNGYFAGTILTLPCRRENDQIIDSATNTQSNGSGKNVIVSNGVHRLPSVIVGLLGGRSSADGHIVAEVSVE